MPMFIIIFNALILFFYYVISLWTQVKTLEEEAYPTLDELNVKICKFTLDCVRRIKGRLLLLNKRVQKVLFFFNTWDASKNLEAIYIV